MTTQANESSIKTLGLSIERRDFLKGGAALALSYGSLFSLAATAASTPAVNVALYDARYSDSRRFAVAVKSLSAAEMMKASDIAQLWYGSLRKRFDAAAPHRIAGMTTHSDLLLMQGFVHERGGRMLFQACHDCRGSSQLTHTVHLHAEASGRNLSLGNANDWQDALARLAMTACEQPSRNPAAAICASTPRSSDHPGTLWSWVVGWS